MALKELSESDVRELTVEEKDRWWLENVYRGNMAQLTFRSAITGVIVGGLLSLTNLYVGAKVGASFGVAITSVVLSFAMFRALSRIGIAHDMTLLENNCMQSIASVAGYMAGGLISALPAFMAISGKVIPIWQSILWLISTSLLGMLFAIPLKRRFINDEQLPFPEGRAAANVLDALHLEKSADTRSKPRILGFSAIAAALITVWQSPAITKLLRIPFTLPATIDGGIDWLASKLNWTPAINGASLGQLGVRFRLDMAVIALGALLGIRIGGSFLIGAILNYCVLGPLMIDAGDIAVGPRGNAYDIRQWSVWPGVALLSFASLTPFVVDWRKLTKPLATVFSKRATPRVDPLEKIEVPRTVPMIGIPLTGCGVVLIGYFFFNINPLLGITAIPLAFVFALIAANATGRTGATPAGPMGKLTQLVFAGLAPNSITTNVMAAGITGETSLSASMLLNDIKPGYLLGANPRYQVVGHVLGIIAGSVASTFVAYELFIPAYVSGNSASAFPLPAAEIWTKVALALSGETQGVPVSAGIAAAVFSLFAIGYELGQRRAGKPFPISLIAVGFAMVIPFWVSFSLFLGAFLIWLPTVALKNARFVKHVLVENRDTCCSGLIAGASIAGILVATFEISQH